MRFLRCTGYLKDLLYNFDVNYKYGCIVIFVEKVFIFENRIWVTEYGK